VTAIKRLLPTALPLVLLLAAAGSPAVAQAADWDATSRPWTGPSLVRDIDAFPPTGIAAAGDDGTVSVSTDGGVTWVAHVPSGFAATSFTAVAFASSSNGVVASGGTLLVTADGGRTWRRPVFAGPAPAGQILDVALRRNAGYAVGEGGAIFATTDEGASWQAEDSPATGDVVAVAVADDGTAIAGTTTGEVLVRSGGAWSLAATLGDPVSAVAASSVPVWGDGSPDLLLSAGSAVLGSDDAVTFTVLPDAPATAWSGLAWLGQPDQSALLAGPATAGFWSPSGTAWQATSTGLGGAVAAAAPGDESVAYVLGPDGRIARTFSSGRTASSLSISAANVEAGSRVTLTGVIGIAAPGVIEIDRRVPGRAWAPARGYVWATSSFGRTLNLSLTPSLTTEYRVRFRYGASWTTLSSGAVVEVSPRLTPARLHYVLRKGAVYRFSGRVSPALPGERVQLFTDRGGSWRPVARDRSVRVSTRGSWTSRQFGTPKSERYRLRAFVRRTSKHGEAWSAAVTVTIR
jgi:photosystem II stability/assembly factor-like uncharacterized protein